MVEHKIRTLFLSYPEVLYGFTQTAYSEYASAYRSALVFAVPYGEQLTIETYSEAAFERGVRQARGVVDEIVSKLQTILKAEGVPYFVPTVAQSSEVELRAPFSFKDAAIHAGLGWMGKNDVVITSRYGPRVRLSAVLIDAPFAYGKALLHSQCPKQCARCVDACPHNALHGVQWSPDACRSDLIDYQLCNQKRSLFLKTHGRKSACGLCLVACPFGAGALAAPPRNA